MAVHTRAAAQQRVPTSHNTGSNSNSCNDNNVTSRNSTNGSNIESRPRILRFRQNKHHDSLISKQFKTPISKQKYLKGAGDWMVKDRVPKFNDPPNVICGRLRKTSKRPSKRYFEKTLSSIFGGSAGAPINKLVEPTEAGGLKKKTKTEVCVINNEYLSEQTYATSGTCKHAECIGVEDNPGTSGKCCQHVCKLFSSVSNPSCNEDFAGLVNVISKSGVHFESAKTLHSAIRECSKVEYGCQERGISVKTISKIGKVKRDDSIVSATTKEETRVKTGRRSNTRKGALPCQVKPVKTQAIQGVPKRVTYWDTVVPIDTNTVEDCSEKVAESKKSAKMFQYSSNLNIPTRTTSTLTPTMLRNIQESFMEYDDEVQPPLEHQMAAGFAPPSVIVQQFGPSGTSGNQRELTSTVGTHQESCGLDEESINTLQQEQHNLEVKQEIVEEDAGWVQTPWTNPRLLPSTIPKLNTTGGDTDSSIGLQQTHMDFTQALGVTSSRPPIPLSGPAIPSHGCNGTGTAAKRRTDLISSGVVPKEPTIVSEKPSHLLPRRKVKEEGLPPEEEERRRQRRERNKLAAARCRQRRVDQTNELQLEVDALEDIQKELRGKLDSLKQAKEELERLLQQHSCVQQRPNNITNSSRCQSRVPATTSADLPVSDSVHMSAVCLQASNSSQSSVSTGMISQETAGLHLNPQQTTRFIPTTGATCAATLTGSHPPGVGSVTPSTQVKVIVRCKDTQDSRLLEPIIDQTQPQLSEKRSRPNSLAINMFDETGIPVQTPSAGMYSFEALVEGTGLTPGATSVVTPVTFSSSCTAQQQKSNGGDSVQTPDTPRKLVTL